MKQKTFVSLIGAVCMLYAAMVSIGCNTAAGLPGDNPLAGTRWEANTTSLYFVQNGNIAVIYDIVSARYTVKDGSITFDISDSLAAIKKLTTVDSFINAAFISPLQKQIDELQSILDSNALTEQDKANIKVSLAGMKQQLEKYKNPTSEEKQYYEKRLTYTKKLAEFLEKEKHTTFEGTFNAEKTKLTIKKFPVDTLDETTGNISVTLKEVTFTKLVQP